MSMWFLSMLWPDRGSQCVSSIPLVCCECYSLLYQSSSGIEGNETRKARRHHNDGWRHIWQCFIFRKEDIFDQTNKNMIDPVNADKFPSTLSRQQTLLIRLQKIVKPNSLTSMRISPHLNHFFDECRLSCNAAFMLPSRTLIVESPPPLAAVLAW